jgi:hypothetical protein
MATVVGVGTTSYVRYGYESTYGTSPGDSSLVTYFGHNVKFSPSAKNNIERIPEMNSRNYNKYAAKSFEGSYSLDFDVSNFYFMKGILGSVASVTTTSTAHTYSEANLPPGITIQSSEDLDTDSERTYTGCLMDKLTLSMNVGEIVKGRIDGMYQKEVKDSSLNTNGNSADTEEVFTFAHATVELPTSTTLTEVQSCEISITNNWEPIYGMGSRLFTQRAAKQRVYEIKLGKVREADSDLLNSFYGSTTTLANPNKPADVATFNLTLTNGLSTTSTRSFTMKLDSLQIDPYNIAYNPAEVLKEDVTLYATNLNSSSKAVYTNNTGTHP